MTRLVRNGLFVLLLGAGLVACSSSEEAPSSGGNEALIELPADVIWQITMRDVEFDRDTVEVEAGDLLVIEMTNVGDVLHDLTLGEMTGEYSNALDGAGTRQSSQRAVHVPFRSGQEGEIRLRFDTPGTYEFFCDVSGHRRAGMLGTIIVR